MHFMGRGFETQRFVLSLSCVSEQMLSLLAQQTILRSVYDNRYLLNCLHFLY